jgi:hypothetical protein
VGCTFQFFLIMSYSFLLSPMLTSCTVHCNLLGFIAVIILVFKCNI